MRTLPLLVSALFLTAITARAELPSCDQLLTTAKVKAAAEHKAIYIHYGASWCGWCKRLEAFLDDDKVKPVFEKYFVPVKLVMKQNEKDPALGNAGADELFKTLKGTSGLPWHAFLGADGKLIVSSDHPPGQNIGYPDQPEEIAWFMQMVKKAAPTITDPDLKTIETALDSRKVTH